MESLSAVARRALPVWLIALTMVGLAELGARALLQDDGRWQYWNRTMATKVSMLQRLEESGRAPDLLVLGDSSAAFNLQPAVFDEVLGTHGYNLGSAGNYAASFDVTVTRGILPELGFTPRLAVVSFAAHGFDPEHVGQTERVLSSPLGRRLQGHRVWGDLLYLVRAHHLLRLLRDPPANPSLRRQQGFESYVDALDRRRRRPGLAQKLPEPPPWMVRHQRRQALVLDEPLEPFRNLFRWAVEHRVGVVVISPPSETVNLQDQIGALCQDWGVPYWDYTQAPFKHHLSHLSVEGARRYSTQIARRLKEHGPVDPPAAPRERHDR